MTRSVVEVGPATVRGPKAAPQQWISTAIEFIDDPIALLDEQPVEVSALWRDVLEPPPASARDTRARGADLVVGGARALVSDPPWRQCGCRCAATRSLLAAATDATVVELSAEYVVVLPLGTPVLPRGDARLAARLETANAVLLDVPAGVPPLGGAHRALRAAGIPVAHNDRRRLLRAVAAVVPDRAVGDRTCDRSGQAAAAGRGAGGHRAVGGGCRRRLGGAGPVGDAPADGATTLLVDGRVAVMVPAPGPSNASRPVPVRRGCRCRHRGRAPPCTSRSPTVQRRRRSPRSPNHSGRQSTPSLTGCSSTSIPPQNGGRPAVTYREMRADSETRWAVFVDGTTRIAIGCQSAPASRHAIDDACVQAVRSARVVR